MLPRNHPDRMQIAFDDHRLVANAGLILPPTLALPMLLALGELVDHHLDFGGAPGRVNPPSPSAAPSERWWPNTRSRWRPPQAGASTPCLGLRLVNLPGYSPDFNGDEAIWGWAREEATGNLCLGSKAKEQERVGSFLAGLASRKEEVKRRRRTVLQSKAEALVLDSRPASPHPANAHPTLALV